MRNNYELTMENRLSEDNIAYIAYGIKCQETGCPKWLVDISCEEHKVKSLIEALNMWDFPVESFYGIVEQWVGG